MNPVLYWNGVLLEATRRDHTLGMTRTPSGDAGSAHGGPTRTSRAMAIVSIAIHDAVCAVENPSAAYLTKKAGRAVPAMEGASVDDVVAGAAHAALKALYPRLDTFLEEAVVGGVAKNDAASQAVRAQAAMIGEAIIELRKADDLADGAYRPDSQRRAPNHQYDPFNPGQGHLNANWGRLDRFGLNGPGKDGHFPLVCPPQPMTPDYTASEDEVQRKGVLEGSTRSVSETEAGLFWGYDGGNEIGVPPRLYNQIARQLVFERDLSPMACAEVLAALNVAMADAGIDAWHWKYAYDFWRPVVGLNPPYGAADWKPLGLPRTNDARPEATTPMTPHFPAYPSGHATFGAAAFQVLRLCLRPNEAPIGPSDVLRAEELDTPEIAEEVFTFTSDELNDISFDAGPRGARRRLAPRRFKSFAHAVSENALSRVYLGVHWRFDGIKRPEDSAEYGGVPLGLEIGKQAHALFATAPSLMGVTTAAE